MTRRNTRTTITLEKTGQGYGANDRDPTGLVTLDIRGSKAKILSSVYGLKPELIYKLAFAKDIGDGAQWMILGSLNVTPGGKMELKTELNADDVVASGCPIEDMGAVLVLSGKDAVLVGYIGKRFDWRKSEKPQKPVFCDEKEKADVNEGRSSLEPEQQAGIAKTKTQQQADEHLAEKIPQAKEELAAETRPEPLERGFADLISEPKEGQFAESCPVPEKGPFADTIPETKSEQAVELNTELNTETNASQLAEEKSPATDSEANAEVLPDFALNEQEGEISDAAIQSREREIKRPAARTLFPRMPEIRLGQFPRAVGKTEISTKSENEQKSFDETRKSMSVPVEGDGSLSEKEDPSPQVGLSNKPFSSHEQTQSRVHPLSYEESLSNQVAGVNETFRNMARRINEEISELSALVSGHRDEPNEFDAAIERILAENARMRPFKDLQSDITWVRIAQEELALLPSIDFVKIAESPFVQSKYYEYKHLLLGQSRKPIKQIILGVPDMYDPKWHDEAEKLGFAQFKPCEGGTISKGCYGYWLTIT